MRAPFFPLCINPSRTVYNLFTTIRKKSGILRTWKGSGFTAASVDGQPDAPFRFFLFFPLFHKNERTPKGVRLFYIYPYVLIF